MYRIFRQLVIGWLLLYGNMLFAEDISREQIKGLDEQVQDIKKDVLDLTAELSLLEEKLLFPSNTQVSFFVSLTEGDNFKLDAVQLKLNSKVVAQHLYTFRELEALQSGGVQRVYTGNVKTGDHELMFSYRGRSVSGGEYKRSATYTVSKAVGPKFVEIKVAGPDSSQQDIRFKDW